MTWRRAVTGVELLPVQNSLRKQSAIGSGGLRIVIRPPSGPCLYENEDHTVGVNMLVFVAGIPLLTVKINLRFHSFVSDTIAAGWIDRT